MSLTAMVLVLNSSSEDDSPLSSQVDRFVLLALADNADELGFAYPFHSTVCRKTALSLPAVKKAIRKADRAGLLWRAGRDRPNGSATSSVYRLNLAALAALGEQAAPAQSMADLADHPLLAHFDEKTRKGWGL